MLVAVPAGKLYYACSVEGLRVLIIGDLALQTLSAATMILTVREGFPFLIILVRVLVRLNLLTHILTGGVVDIGCLPVTL